MNWNIDDVPVFVAVVEKQGITAAARELGMPKSTVSSALTRLEQGLGLRLVDRNSRNLRVTGEGDTFYRQALRIMEQVQETDAAMSELTSVPSGRLAVALPPAFCNQMLAPHLSEFHAAFPGIRLELVVTSRAVDMIRDRVDVAIVVGPQDDSELILRNLVSGTLRWVTSRRYLEQVGGPGAILDPLPHVQICEKRYGQRRMPVRINGHATEIDLSHGITHVNDPQAVRTALLHGAGISPIPEFYFRPGDPDCDLVEVCPHITFDPAVSQLSVIYPSRRLVSPKIRAFLDLLERICRPVAPQPAPQPPVQPGA